MICLQKRAGRHLKQSQGGARDSIRNESGRFTASDQNDHLRKESRKTAEKIASEHNVSYGAVVRANGFAKGLDTADKDMHQSMVADEKGREKVIAALSEAEAAIKKIKELYL